MEELTGKERNILSKAAHSLKPIVMIGKNGVTPEIRKALDAALNDHELMKIKYQDFKDDKKSLTTSLAESVGAAVISVIGNIAILYREPEED
ncbi:MAG: YhbY family RNA-binding protein [Spirochaetales bacterium]|nr:YhbY family RNA-binding protein [Spirochaetales bacterium]